MKILFTFLTEKKPCLGPIKSLLLNFHQQIIMISSQNNVQKYRTKGHEQFIWTANDVMGKKILWTDPERSLQILRVISRLLSLGKTFQKL